MPILDPLRGNVYESGALIQKCDECQWAQRGHKAEVAAALADRVTFDLSHRNGSVFGDMRIGEDRAVDIIKWVVDAFKARARIDWLGGDISIEELAALAKVSEKTLRMAANPKNEVALRTKKNGHRTFITTEDAMDWLARRPDFVPTRNPKQAFPAELHIGGGPTQLKVFMADLIGRNPGLHVAASESGMTVTAYAALHAGELGAPNVSLEPDVLARFAAKAGIERATVFVRWVLDLQYRERVSRLEAAYKRQVMTLAPASEGDSP